MFDTSAALKASNSCAQRARTHTNISTPFRLPLLVLMSEPAWKGNVRRKPRLILNMQFICTNFFLVYSASLIVS